MWISCIHLDTVITAAVMSGKDWVSACLARRARGGVVTVRDESGGQHEVGAADMPDRFFFGLCPACHKAGPRHDDDEDRFLYKRAYSASTEDSIKTMFLMQLVLEQFPPMRVLQPSILI